MINQERLIALFLQLVRTDSPSREERRIAKVIAGKLSALGAEPQIDALWNVTAKFPGAGAGIKRPPLFLNAHSDNVPPARGIHPIVADRIIKSDGTTVLGADDLAGVAAILEAIRSLQEERVAYSPLEIAITTQEEAGMYGAKGLDLSGFNAREGVVVDGPGPVGVVTYAAPSVNLIDIEITGKAAHSGHAPEAGINALLTAVDAIGGLKIGRIDKRTTTNIGILRGGSARNMVPAQVELTAEVRSHNDRKLELVTDVMKRAFERACRASHAKLEFKVKRAYSRFEINKSDPLVVRVVQALEAVGRAPQFERSMGGYDANIWNERGIKCVAVSVGDELNHTTDEFIPIGELYKTAQLVEQLVRV